MSDGCQDCDGPLRTREDSGGEYQVCSDCGLRQGGLGRLQKRFGGIL